MTPSMIRLHTAPLLFALFVATGCAHAPSQSPLQQQLDQVARHYYRADAPGAAVLVTRNGQVLLRAGYGLADLENPAPITPDTVFQIGSLTKQFTAVAILQLVEAGKVALDVDFRRYLPEFPATGGKVTVEQLLNHTSGIVNYTSLPSYKDIQRKTVVPQLIVDQVKDQPRDFPPGTRYKYNNTAFALLGMIVEKVSGMGYAQYLETHVYPRAGLAHTAYNDLRKPLARRAHGYAQQVDATFRNADYTDMSVPFSAGALLSTVDDLANWTEAVDAGRVVSRELVDKAWTAGALSDGTSIRYGYGWGIGTDFDSRVIRHNGVIPGFFAAALWMPDERIFVAVLTNFSPQTPTSVDPTYVAQQLASYVIGKPYPLEPAPLTPVQIADYVGTYGAGQDRREFLVLDGLLFLKGKIYDKPVLQLAPDLLTTTGDGMNFYRFERDGTGAVTGMTYGVSGPVTRSAKDRKDAK